MADGIKTALDLSLWTGEGLRENWQELLGQALCGLASVKMKGNVQENHTTVGPEGKCMRCGPTPEIQIKIQTRKKDNETAPLLGLNILQCLHNALVNNLQLFS